MGCYSLVSCAYNFLYILQVPEQGIVFADIAPTAPCVEVCKKSVIKMASKETSWTFDSVFKGTENQESLWTGESLDPRTLLP